MPIVLTSCLVVACYSHCASVRCRCVFCSVHFRGTLCCTGARSCAFLAQAEDPRPRRDVQFSRCDLQLFHHLFLSHVVPDSHDDERFDSW